jgi:tetratricopeptide (TPR) repeat protein
MTSEKVWQSLNAQIFQAYHKGKYTEAITLAKKAREYAAEYFGKAHSDTLISINNLAALYQSQDRYAEAEPLYKEAMQLREKILGKAHPNTLTSQLNYIILLVNIDIPRKAFHLLKKMEVRLFSRSFQELYTTSEARVRRLFLKTISKFQNITFSFAQKYPDPLHIR